MIYAVGDIHGQVTMLRALWKQLPLKDDDVLLFLGDYIDRGEDSCGVIEELLKIQQQHENVIFLRGNHEQMMLDARDAPSPELKPDSGFIHFAEPVLLWLQNGGADALLSYQMEDYSRWAENIPLEHWDFVRATQMEYVTEPYHFVHAGLARPGEHWEGEKYGLDARLWIREPFLSDKDYYNDRIIVFGHTPQLNGRPLVQRNKIGLDTGAVFGGPLTAAAFNLTATGSDRLQPRFYQVDYVRS